MTRAHHVNLPVPPGRSGEVADFWQDVLGAVRIARPDTGRAGAWLDVPGALQVHLSERQGAAHEDQHVAFVVDDLPAYSERAAAAGAPWEDRGPGRAALRDPAGTLVELFAEGHEPS